MNPLAKDDQEELKINPIYEFVWALTGLMLTIFGTFVEVFFVIPQGTALEDFNPTSLGVTYQLVGVFLTGCLAGKNAGAYAQIAYLVLGLFKLPVFYQGGTFEYLDQPSFGYILGFIPGAWLCGYLAIPGKRKLEIFVYAIFFGLLVVHLCGILYLVGYTFITPIFGNDLDPNYLTDAINLYTITPFLSQMLLIPLIAIIAFIIRVILFY
ncbi:biotin transporter BioY [Cyanobacterium sp. HL-69]|uniref:biotin transporter BioY n=1 Tax=Cyanobacterium sp. HL-69 TaxID=2054282 RepID=UPI00406BBAC9